MYHSTPKIKRSPNKEDEDEGYGASCFVKSVQEPNNHTYENGTKNSTDLTEYSNLTFSSSSDTTGEFSFMTPIPNMKNHKYVEKKKENGEWERQMNQRRNLFGNESVLMDSDLSGQELNNGLSNDQFYVEQKNETGKCHKDGNGDITDIYVDETDFSMEKLVAMADKRLSLKNIGLPDDPK